MELAASAKVGDVEEGAACAPLAKPAAPSVDDVLYSLRAAPFTFEDLLEFSQREHSAENAQFWATVEHYRQVHEGTAGPAAVRVEATELASAERARRLIVDKFVADSAPEQVNISSSQRVTVLRAAGAASVSPRGVFDEAQAEIKLLIQNDTLPRFIRSARSTNISKPQAQWRERAGWAMLLASALLVGLVFLLEYLAVLSTPWARLAGWPLCVLGLGYLISGRQQV
jgi:hypothetical protein